MARSPAVGTPSGTVKSTDRGAKWHGALDANIIIANAPDPVFVSDLEGKILQANDAVSHLLGFRQDEVLEQSLSDRKSTRLNSSHGYISYAVFCLKKKNNGQAAAAHI